MENLSMFDQSVRSKIHSWYFSETEFQRMFILEKFQIGSVIQFFWVGTHSGSHGFDKHFEEKF